MSTTYSRSDTSTYTEARARYVLQKAYDDFVGLYTHNLIDKQKALRWYTEIKFVTDLQAMQSYEVQVSNYGTIIKAWKYDVVSDGMIYEDSDSGGIDYSDIPSTAKVNIVLSLVDDGTRRQKAVDYLRGQGWGMDGISMTGDSRQDRTFSKDGFGLKRTIYEVQK